MATVGFCGFKPMHFRKMSFASESVNSTNAPKKPSKAQNERKGESMQWSSISADQLILMTEVHKKILVFRDIMDLAPLNSTASLHEMVITTLEDLQRLYPWIIPRKKVSKIKDNSIDQGLAYFCEALKSLGESWMMKNDCMDIKNYEFPSCKDKSNMRQLGETMLATLDCLINIASDKFDIMEEDDQKKEPIFTYSSSLATPKSVLPEPMKYPSRAGDSPRSSCTSPLWSLRIQAVGKLNPIDLKRLCFHMPPPYMQYKNNKIEQEPTKDVEMDDKARNPGKDTSEDLVFDLESNRKTGDQGNVDKPQAMEEVEILVSTRPLQPQYPKPAETHALLQKEPEPVSSPPSPPQTPTPSIIQPNTVPLLPPLVPTLPVLQPNVAMAPPPRPPSAPKLQQTALIVRMPPPPPPPPLSLGSNSAAASPPPLPPMSLKSGSAPAPPPLMPCGNRAAAPPPPPLGAGRSLRPKATTKLKRSTQLGNLYRTLKGKVEGSSIKCKSSSGRTGTIGAASTGGKQGMADARWQKGAVTV